MSDKTITKSFEQISLERKATDLRTILKNGGLDPVVKARKQSFLTEIESELAVFDVKGGN